MLLALSGLAVSAVAATPSEFYGSLLRRGVAAFDGGHFDEAARHLRLAAFGFVDTLPSYVTAHAYLALAYDKLGDADHARDSARRILQAERIERTYASAPLPASVRTAFDALANRLLTPAEVAGLRGSAPLAAPQTTAPRTTVVNPSANNTNKTNSTKNATNTNRPKPVVTQQPPVTVDRIEVQTVKPAPAQTQTQPQQTPAQTTTPRPATMQPATTQPPSPSTTTTQRPAQTQPQKTATKPQPAQTQRVLTAAEVNTRITAAERALNAANLTDARRLYREVLAIAALDHAIYIRIAEGLYRARDFAGALAGFERAGSLRKGEEPYRYYVAVALYETGQFDAARRELAAALPYIEVTPDVASYRTKIETAR
ncbi:MAG: tetratricopeptide repeat protein [Acidobacteriota bacterium]|nr:tetratricopeptide repeat protein [Acidobacteriota bacterium]